MSEGSLEILTPSGGRINVAQHLYYEIAELAFVQCIKLKDAMAKFGSISEDDYEAYQQINKLDDASLAESIKCVVFSGMCLEAALYDFSAWHLESSIVEALDKADFVAKWKAVPLLVGKYEFPNGGFAHNHLIKLNGIRNKLVHAKSYAMKFDAEQFRDQIKKAKEQVEVVRGAYQVAIETVIAVSIEFDLNMPQYVNPLPHFINTKRIPEQLGPKLIPEIGAIAAAVHRKLKTATS